MTNADDRATLDQCRQILLHDCLAPQLTIKALRSALQVPDAAQARREAIEEAVWLIELSAPGAPSMYLGRCGWSTPYFAIRYSRKEDAEAGYSLFARSPSPHVRFTEHVWMAAQPDARGEMEQIAQPVRETAQSVGVAGEPTPEAASDNGSRASPVLATKLPPASPPPDDAAAQAKRVFAAWSRAFERHDTRPAAEVVLEIVRSEINRLRQPPAPEPDPDVFEAFGEDVAFCSTSNIKLRARDWFQPIIAALEFYAGDLDYGGEARRAMAQLRARAKEASRG